MMDWDGHMTTGGWILAILWMVIIVGLIAGALYWLVASLTGKTTSQQSSTTEGSAREILDRRLAKGELTIEQYKQLRETIGEESPPGGQPSPPARPAGAPG